MIAAQGPAAHIENQLMRYAWRHFMTVVIYGRKSLTDYLREIEMEGPERQRAEALLGAWGIRTKGRRPARDSHDCCLIIATTMPVLDRLMKDFDRGARNWERAFLEIGGARTESAQFYLCDVHGQRIKFHMAAIAIPWRYVAPFITGDE